MRLFPVASAAPSSTADVPVLATPLGDIRFRATVGGTALPERTDDAHRLSGGAHVFGWDRGQVRVELLICRPRIQLPPGLAMTDCRAAMWRVSASASTGPLSFACALNTGSRRIHAGPETGECLEAQSWSDGRTRVTAGTADGELLWAQAYAGDLLPRRWLTADPRTGGEPGQLGIARYTEDALSVELPGLDAGERCQLHFTVAWGPEDDDAATWFAADCPPGQVLAGAGLSG